jgi:hypothetical protein
VSGSNGALTVGGAGAAGIIEIVQWCGVDLS